jgi:hypothetical protein
MFIPPSADLSIRNHQHTPLSIGDDKMPLKLCVGLSRKVGLPDYGSLGASCHVELELDNSLLQTDLDSFQRHVRDAYVACGQAVSDELARQRASDNNSDKNTAPAATNGNHNSPAADSSGNGNHQATQKQLDYLQQLARQIRGLGVRKLEELAQHMFGKPLAASSSFEASSLIDTLKAIKAGQLSLEEVLQGAVS